MNETRRRFASRKVWLAVAGVVALVIVSLGATFALASRGTDPDLATSAPELPTSTAIPVPTSTVMLQEVATSAAAPTSTPPLPTAVAPPTPAAPQVQRFAIDGAQSTARFIVQKTVLTTTSSAVATGSGVSGVFFASSNGLGTAAPSSFKFDLRTLQTSDILLKGFLNSGAIDTTRYPFAEFVASANSPFSAGYGTGAQFNFNLTGTLTMNGLSREVTFQVLAKQSGSFFTATGDTDIRMSDFNVIVPNLPIGRAGDLVHVQITFVAAE